MLDRIELTLQAGNGGKGCTALWHNRRPYGGNGGDGGDLYLEGSTNVIGFSSLPHKNTYKADNGQDGLPLNKFGRRADDLTLLVPLTTEVVIDGEVRFKIEKDGQREKILSGGKGTLGNLSIKMHPYRKGATEMERQGEKAEVTLVLKLTADVIFMGYPNAGKSSLLNKLTNAKAKTAAYEFTTLEPQTGHMGTTKLMDLPGLIDGTHEGKGLGTAFVQHTEYCRMVAHLVGLEAEKPVKRYQELRKEILLISEDLYNKPEVVLLTKSDESTPAKITAAIKQFEKLGIPVVPCSILDDDSIEKVKALLETQLQKHKDELTKTSTEIESDSPDYPDYPDYP